jgi:hypothetical protein
MSTPTSAMLAKSHAELAPSKAHRWLVCPGSVHVTAEDPETEWAAEGTRKHAVLAYMLRARKDSKLPALLADDTIETEAGPYKVPLQVLEQCAEILAFIDDFRSTHVDGWVVEEETPVEIGSRVWPGVPVGLCRGTTDVAAYSYEELLVLDAKFGFVQVQAQNNPQLLLYASGLLEEIPFPIKHVVLCVAQPGYDGVVLFREYRMTVEEVREWAFQQQHIVEEIQAHSRRLQADFDACRYCPARIQCPARLKALDDAMVEGWVDERSLPELLAAVPTLRAICKDIEQRALAELNQGHVVQGWKAVAAKSRRKWKDPAVAAEALKAVIVKTGRDPSGIYETPKLLSPAKMEKALRGGATKHFTVKEAAAIVNEHAFQPEGGPKLVPITDERPALEPAKWSLEDFLAASLEAHDADE